MFREDDETFLEKYCDLKIIKNVVTADSVSSIVGERVENKKIKIGDEIYNLGEMKRPDMVGHYVKAFVTNYDSQDNELKAIYDKSEKISVMYEDISPETTKTTFYYFDEKDKRISERISGDVYVVYNGVPINNWDEKTLIPDYGFVKLIKYDDVVDCIFVWNYDNKLVKNVVKSSNKVIFDDTTSIDFNNIDDYRIVVGNEVGDITSITENSVLMIAESLDKSSLSLFVSIQSVSGKINSKSNDEINIEGNTYKTNIDITGVKIGDNCIFYLDGFNRVSFYKIDNDLMCGYLIKMIIDDDEENAGVKLFTENGEILNFQLADKVNLYDGKQARVRYEEVDFYWNFRDYIKECLIKYKQNLNGEINVVYMPEYEGIDNFGNDYFTCNVDTEKMLARGEIESEGCEFTNSYLYITEKQTEYNVFVNDTTKLFYVAGDSEDDWKMLKTSSLALGQRLPGMKVYNISQNGIAEIVLVKSNDVQIGDTYERTDPMFLFESGDYQLNEYDEVVMVIKGISNLDGEVSYELKYEDLVDTSDGSLSKGKKISEVKPGDMIQLKLDSTGKVVAFTTLYEYQWVKEGKNFAGRAFAQNQETRLYIGRNKENIMYVGPLLEANQDTIVIKNEYLATKRAYALVGYTTFAKYDSKRRKVEIIDKSELYSGATIFTYMQPEWLRYEVVVIYE